jgi:molecular chaperone HtpG
MSVETHKETLQFQTEARQLLRLMIHSLYSNSEIFLRELISNASDACDKLRFEALTDDALYEGDSMLRVRISCDPAARTITISDNGIGMNRAEVAGNIGTIAGSGTRRFLESLSGDEARDAKLIGQFGVGFYSAFIVADRVVLTTRRAGLGPGHGVRWESDGEGEYTLETVERDARGTEVVLHLREGQDEFLDGHRLRAVIRRYSDSLSLPVEMKTERPGEGEAAADVWEQVNRASALWTRPRSEISDEEYNDFYRHVAHDFADPLARLHVQVEGRQTFTSLLYIPKRAPFDLWDRERGHGVKLYVRRVFIMDNAEGLLPGWLRFVRGVVDSDDLPLNVSREMLQHNRQIDVIRGSLVKKLLGQLKDIADNDPGKYREFWQEFGRVLKEGPVEDPGNTEQIAKLLRFPSTRDDGKTEVSLDDYIGRIKEGQDRIWYITAESLAAAINSPHLEIFRKKGIEVLLLCDRIDEWLLTGLTEYAGKPLQSVARGDLALDAFDDEQEKQAIDAAAEALGDLAARMKAVLEDRVEQVRLSHRLTDSPSCLVVEQNDMTLNLRRMLEAAGQKLPAGKPILELNPRHPLVERLGNERDERRFADWSHVLYEQALLSEGGQLDDPAAFVRRLNGLLMAQP